MKKLTKIQAANVRKWVKALRSGKYKQTTGALCRLKKTEYRAKGYCCLGVACEVLKIERRRKVDGSAVLFAYGKEEETGVLPKKAQKLLGLLGDSSGILRPAVEFREDEACELTELNDAGASFDFIADVIEKQFLGKGKK